MINRLNRTNSSSLISQKCLSSIKPFAGMFIVFSLAACGGGSGDEIIENDPNPGIEIVPLAGTWNLPGDWSGQQNDQATLLIRQPASDGVAEAVLFDYDDAETGLGLNCYNIDGEGSIEKSADDRLFMDISAFPDAVVSLNGAEMLQIVFTDGVATGTDRTTKTLNATRVDITETDITPLC